MLTLAGVVLGLSLASFASAQGAPGACQGRAGLPSWVKPGVFRGTLGGQAVALGLGPGDDGNEARYFYERRGMNIALRPSRVGDALLLREEVWSPSGGGMKVTGCLRLERAGTGLRGSWTSPDGRRTLPVTLAPLDVTRLPLNLPDSPGLRKLRETDPMTFLKLNHPWVKEAGGASVREGLSGIRYPRLPGGSAALDAALQDRQLEYAANALDCFSGVEGAPGSENGGWYELLAAPTFRGRLLFSLSESGNFYCGGAHPDNFDRGLILDRVTGREVPVTAIWPGLTPARLDRLYRAHSAANADCREVVVGEELDLTANLTPRGLALTPTGLPHVVAACAETVTLPYAFLRFQANPEGPYFRDLYSR